MRIILMLSLAALLATGAAAAETFQTKEGC